MGISYPVKSIKYKNNMLDTLDINNLLLVRDCVSGITGIPLTIYDEKGGVVLPQTADNKVTAHIRSSKRGQKEYDTFIRKSVESLGLRKDISMYKGPGGQYYFFIPIRIDNVLFVITGGGIYLSQKDLEDFYVREGRYYEVTRVQIRSWLQEIVFRDFGDIKQTARYVQSLFSYFLRNSMEKSLHAKKYRLTKTVLSLMSGLDADDNLNEIYDLLGDVLLFLFDADSVSVMIKEEHVFKQVRSSGRLKGHLDKGLIDFTGSLPGMIKSKGFFYTENTKEILRFGFDEQITSVHVFPIELNGETEGCLCIFNTTISQGDTEIISELCKVVAFMFKIIDLRRAYTSNLRHLDMLNTATTNIIPVKAPEALYEAIVNMSAHLAGAEKGSLMLCENGSSSLKVKAAKGINKILFDEIKIRAGEGIAGKVFERGMPLLVNDIEKNSDVPSRRRPRYKTGSFISIPLVSVEKTIGVLNIADKTSGAVFSEDDMTLLRSFASYASIAIERSLYCNLVGLLKELSITDPLTGLFNRRYFEERLFEEINRSERHLLPFSVAIIDIDDFKLFNDSEGHLEGDDALKNISAIAKESLRVIDVIARFGGEEFAVIMPQTEKEEAYVVVERIRKAVKEKLPRTWKTFPREHLTICIGVSTFPADGKNRVDLLKSADKALFSAKLQGKDRTVLFGKEQRGGDA